MQHEISLQSNKRLRVLGLFALLLFGSFSQLLSQNISYQSPKKPIKEILDDISREYGLYFSYAPQSLSAYQSSIYAEEQAVEDFLFQLLDPFDLQAKRSKGNYFYIQKVARKISFQILDKESLEPLAYAIVRSVNSPKGAYANDQGRASFVYDIREDSLIQINHLGYLKRYILIKEEMPEVVVIHMEPDSIGLEEVIIEYNNEAITLKEGAQFDLNPGNMKVLPGLAEADVLLSVQSLPGIASNDETASGINVRGGGSDELMVYWDRIPIYKQAHFFGTLTTFIPSTVDKISAFKNYIPAEYTGATSGLLEISLPDSVPNRTQAVANANLTHADLMLELPIQEKLSLLLAARLSFHDQFDSPTFAAHRNKLFSGSRQEEIFQSLIGDEEEDEVPVFRNQTSLSYKDLNAKLLFEPSERDFLSFSFMQNDDNFNFFSEPEESSILAERSHNVSFLGGNFFYRRNWNSRWQSSLSISHADYQMHNEDLGIFDEGTNRNEISIDNSLTNTEAKLSFAYQANKRSKFSLGYQFNSYSNFFMFQETSSFEERILDTLDASETSQGIYLKYHYSWKDKIDFQPQIRIDRIPGLGETLVNPVISFHYKLSPELWFKSSYGQYFQLIRSLREGELDVSNVSESVWLLAEGPPIPGTEDELPIIESRQLSIGGLFKHKGWLIDLDLYWKETEDLSSINQFSSGQSIDFELGDAQALGLDFMLKKNFGRYQTWMSYSFSQLTNNFEGLSDASFPSSFDRPHQFRWVHNLYLAPFEFSIAWMLKSGTPYTPASGISFVPNDPTDPVDPDDPEPSEGFYEIDLGPVNSARLPLYHRLDFSFWYKFEKEPGGLSGQLGFSIQNIYNRENIWQRFFYLDDVDEDVLPEIIREERNFLGFTPNFSLRINF